MKLIPCYSLHLFKICISETISVFSISSLVHFYIFFLLLKIILPSNSFYLFKCYSNSSNFQGPRKILFFYRSLMSSPPEVHTKLQVHNWLSHESLRFHILSSKLCVAFRINWSCGKTSRKAWTYFMQHYNITMMILTY